MTSFENDNWSPAFYTNMSLPVNKRNTLGINHLDKQELRNLIQQLAYNSQVKVQRCDDNMFNNSNRRPEKYPYNSYRPSREGWSRRQESSNHLFSNHNQNDLSTSEYSTNYDGNISAYHPGSNELDNCVNTDVICSQNYKSSEGENWTCEYEEEKPGNFSNNTNIRTYKYRKRRVYRNCNINPRNNYLYDSYYEKPHRKYEENKQTFGFHKYPFHSQTPDSNGQRMYSARDSSSNFGRESFKNYSVHNWEDDHEIIDMDISDSENNYSRSQKRKSVRYDNIPSKKACYEHNVKTHDQILRLKHSDSSDITDDDYVGIKGKDFGRNVASSSSKEYPYKKSPVLEKSCLESPRRKLIDSDIKRNLINAETKEGLIGDGCIKKQFSPSTKTSYENLSKSGSVKMKTGAANKNLKNPNLKYVEMQQEVSTTKEIGSKQCSSEDLNNVGNKSVACPKQDKVGNTNSVPSLGKSNNTKKECSFESDKESIDCSKVPLKKGGQSPGSGKSDLRKSQENLKQLEDVTKSPDITVFSEPKKSEKLLPANTSSNNLQKQHKNIIENFSESKKPEILLPPSSSPGDTQKQHKNVLDVSSVPKKLEKLPRKTFQSPATKSLGRENKLNCSDPKKKTNSVKKERALSLDGHSSQVSSGNKEEETPSKNKKLKVSHRKSIDSEYIKEIPETQSSNLDQGMSDSVIDGMLADLEKQIYIIASDKAVKDNNKLPSTLGKQKPIVAEAGKALKNKDCSKSSSTNKTSSAERKSNKQNDKVATNKENKVKNKDSQYNKVVKSKEDNSGKQTTSKCIKKSMNESRTPIDSDSKAKLDIGKGKKHVIESENKKLTTPSESNSKSTSNQNENTKLTTPSKSNSKSTSNQKLINGTSSFTFIKETTSELLQKSPKNPDTVRNGEPTTNHDERIQVKAKSVTNDVRPAKRITQRRGKSCDARSLMQVDYLELKPLNRSKSVEPLEFTSFRITRSKSPFYGLHSGLPPVTRSRSRSRLSSQPLEEDKQENNTPNSDRILKASDEVKVYKPLLIDMDHKKSVGGYSPRDDDDEVAMHMVNHVSNSSCMIQYRAIDPRDPRKTQFAKKNPVKNGKELIKLKDFVRERFEEESKKGTSSYVNEQTKEIQNILRDVKPVEKQPCKSFVNAKDNKTKSPKETLLKQRKTSNIKGENKKCASSNSCQIKKQSVCRDTPRISNVVCQKHLANKVNVRMEEIEGLFPEAETNQNCIRLNVSNGTEERAVTIQKADMFPIDFIFEETSPLITDPLVSERAQVCKVHKELFKATTTVITIQEANQIEEIVDLTWMDDLCEEQSDLTSINNINKLTEQLLEMYGDEVKPSGVKPESSNSINNLLNILESPVQRRGIQTTSEIEEPPGNNNAAPYTITIKPLVPVQSNEEAQSITIEIPDISIVESTQINSHNTSEMVVATNCVISETSQTVAAQKSLGNAKKINLNEAHQSSSLNNIQCLLPDTPNLSTVMSENASSSDPLTVANSNVSEPPKAGTLSIESNQGCRPAHNVQNLVLPSMVSSSSALREMLLFKPVKRRRPSNKTVPAQSQPPSANLSITQINSSTDQQSVNQNLPVIQQQHSQRLSYDNWSRKLTDVPPNRIAPCNHHGHLQTNTKAYNDFLSNNVYYILKYQCVVEMTGHLFPMYAKTLSEAPSKKYVVSIVQIFFEAALSDVERDLRQYYNAVNLNVQFTKFLVDLDVELSRSGQKLFWKWNLEYLCRLLYRNTSCGVSLNSCYENFISELKKYYETYVSRSRTTQRNLQNAQNNLTEKIASRSSNISVVPLATLQDPNLSTSNSHAQKSSSDQHLAQSIQGSNNNTVILPSTSAQTGSSITQRPNSDQQQHIQSIQTNNNMVIFPVSTTSIQKSSSKTRRPSSGQQQHIQSIQRNNNTVILPVPSTSTQTGSSKTQRLSSDQHQHIQSVQRSNNLSPSTSSNHVTPNQTITNQTYGMTPQQYQTFLQHVQIVKEQGLLLKKQNPPSVSNHYVGGNFSGRTAHCRPSQESVNRSITNLERLEQSCNQLKHSRHQLNLQELLTGQKTQKDYSQNLHNMINAKISSTRNGGSIQQCLPPPYPVHLTLQYQQNKAAPLRPEINSFTLPQQQQNCTNLPPQNNASNERIFSRIMADMAKSSSLINATVSHSQSQVNTPRREVNQSRVSQTSTEVQNLNAPDLNITLELNVIDTQNQLPRDMSNKAVQQQSAAQNNSSVTSTQNSCTISTSQQVSSNSLHSYNRHASVQASPRTDNHSVNATQNEHVPTENDQTSDCISPSALIAKEEVSTEVELTVNEPHDEFIDFENYLTNTHGENWDDDIEVIWPENYVVLPLAEEVKNEDGVQVEIVEDDPIPRSVSIDSGIESPTDIVLPSQFYV